LLSVTPGTAPIGDIRGLGAMVAFEMVAERNTHQPDPEATKALGCVGFCDMASLQTRLPD
jgi:4-aminobutyrate aminotransferase-like enzyme